MSVFIFMALFFITYFYGFIFHDLALYNLMTTKAC